MKYSRLLVKLFFIFLLILQVFFPATIARLQAQVTSCPTSYQWYDIQPDGTWLASVDWGTADPCNPTNPEGLVCLPGYSLLRTRPGGQYHCGESGLPPAPPNYPGINAGASCLAGTERTVNITPTGDSHQLQRSPGNQIVDLIGNNHTYTNMQEGVDYRFRAQARNAGGYSGWSNWTGIVRHDLSAPVTTLDLVGLAGNNAWWRSNVSATLPAIDTGCLGVAETHYTLDGNSVLYNANPIIVSGNGDHTLDYYSSDGVHDEVPQNSLIRIDTLAPSLTISPDRLPDGQNGWWIAPVSVSISGTDATSGIASTEYDLNAAGWQAYTGTITLNSNGTYSIDARVFDNAGWETVEGLSIPIDMTNPRLEFVAERAPDRNGWYNHSVHVGVDYGDNISGISGVVARLNNSDWSAYQGAYLIGGDGEHVFQAAVSDIAGNSTARQTIIKIDITPPVTTVNYDGSTITLSVTDNRSGVLGTTLSINGVVTIYTGNPIPLDEAGDYVIEAYSTDMAGNSEGTQLLRISHDPHVTNVVINSGALPVLQSSLICAAPSYNINGFASATAGLREVYLIAQVENGSEVVLRGQGQGYSYNPSSANVEALAFNYLAQSDVPHQFVVVATDASGNERRQTLTCPTTSSLIVAAPIFGNGASNNPTNDPDKNVGSLTNILPESQNNLGSVNPNTEMNQASNSNLAQSDSPVPNLPYNGYIPASTTVELVSPTSMDLTYVSPSNDLPLDASELGKILAAVGLITTTAAGVVLQQSETAKKKQEELVESLEQEKSVVGDAYTKQIENAQSNAQMNADLQAKKDVEVVLEVQQSEANKAYHEYIADLWASYYANLDVWQNAVANQAYLVQEADALVPGSSIEDLPEDIQKIFWELGNMHYESPEDYATNAAWTDSDGETWNFQDQERRNLGYYQYLIRTAAAEGNMDAVLQHASAAVGYINQTLTTRIDRELAQVRDVQVETTRAKQEVSYNRYSYGNSQSEFRDNQTLIAIDGINSALGAIDNRASELKVEMTSRNHEELSTTIDLEAFKHQALASSTIIANQNAVIEAINHPLELVSTHTPNGPSEYISPQWTNPVEQASIGDGWDSFRNMVSAGSVK